MASIRRLTIAEDPCHAWPFCGPACQCLADFFREEFVKHHRCLERQREYYSAQAIEQAEGVLARILDRVDQLSQRDDAGPIIERLLRQIDAVTNLSAWTESDTLH